MSLLHNIKCANISNKRYHNKSKGVSVLHSSLPQLNSHLICKIENMQKGREVGDNVYGSRGFGDFGGFGLFNRSMMKPSLFGGRDPFDDPFFTEPFDSMWGSSSTAASSRSMQKTSIEKEVVIEELDSDDEGTHQKVFRSPLEPSIEHPDDDDDDDDDDVNEEENISVSNDNEPHESEPSRGRNFSFQTSRVTYGGIDGAYYSSTRTRRKGADGVVMEESKEADSTKGEATHRISRGIHDKGHSFLRKLDANGKVDTTQKLHNLNEEELAGFEETWKGKNKGMLPDYDLHTMKDTRMGESNRNQLWSLPSMEQARRARGFESNYETGTNSGERAKKVVRINIE